MITNDVVQLFVVESTCRDLMVFVLSFFAVSISLFQLFHSSCLLNSFDYSQLFICHFDVLFCHPSVPLLMAFFSVAKIEPFISTSGFHRSAVKGINIEEPDKFTYL